MHNLRHLFIIALSDLLSQDPPQLLLYTNFFDFITGLHPVKSRRFGQDLQPLETSPSGVILQKMADRDYYKILLRLEKEELIHAVTLRKKKLFPLDQVNRERVAHTLMEQMGVNLEGVEAALHMREQIVALQRRSLFQKLRTASSFVPAYRRPIDSLRCRSTLRVLTGYSLERGLASLNRPRLNAALASPN